jgi:pilus assembly protein CpaB
MRMSHLAMLIAALVCATAAALLSRTWLMRQSAQTPAATEAAMVIPSRSVVVAARDIEYGDKLDADAIKLVPWPGDTTPKGAFESKEAMLGAQGSRTALQSMAEGEPVLQNKLLGGATANTLAAKLNKNMKAVTIRVNDVAGVAGFVQPDDRVDVFLTYGKQASPDDINQASSSVVVLLQNIRVLAVDQVTKRKELPTPAKAVTLEVSTEEAQKLILAGRVGDLSLALNRLADKSGPQNTGTVSFNDLLTAEQKVRRAAPGGPVVTVTRSVERKTYQVEPDRGRDESWQHEILSHQKSRQAPAQ